jgi:ABC-type multidrug transport system ATPase subunit
MSEEILKALTQLFAIITKQDGGATERERQFVLNYFQQQLNPDAAKEYIALYDEYSDYGKSEDAEEEGKKKLTSVKDSVRTLGICKKINKTLQQKQKFISLVKLLELLASDRNFTEQRVAIINTVSEVFKIQGDEYKLIEAFVLNRDNVNLFEFEDILVVDETPLSDEEHVKAKHLVSEQVDGSIYFMNVRSEDMYFVRYDGTGEILLNGFIMNPSQVYLFSPGSSIKISKSGKPIYFSDIVAQFRSDEVTGNLSFNVNELEFKFPNGAIGLRHINISEGNGKLIAIMGASGAGKTTLLNVLAGIEKPSSGEVLINGQNLHTENKNIKGLIGYIAQDDILFEDLTVYENLYYNAKLCFKGMPEPELEKRVTKTLKDLGLEHIKHLKVGNVLNKKISGGQRKRLNIALELIREPSVMFVDEPTSGLSSRDSENVMDLLKELTLKGKLIFVVIHQPSSDIFKMFDKLFILDTGGYPAFYGNPIEAVIYFKKATNQIDSDKGQCETCGNVNPEQIFNILEAQVVDEYGQFTGVRKVMPYQWYERYNKEIVIAKKEDVKEALPQSLQIPNKIKQFLVFMKRDLLSKLSNTQYMVINLLEAPLLALLLAFIVRYINTSDGQYLYRYNENIPAFILISVIVALFMGLTVSAEEIIKDRKIQKREKFLNLSRTSYLLSKVSILFMLSAIQTLTFVVVGNWILEIQGMNLSYWAMLFATSCFANMLGMNISASFNSAVTVYIVIPLLLIPQMILSGGIFSFDKLNDLISTKGKVPVIADLMASRWAFEGMIVTSYKNNAYERPIFKYETAESVSDYYQAWLLPELLARVNQIKTNIKTDDAALKKDLENNLIVVKNTIKDRQIAQFFKDIPADKLNSKDFNEVLYEQLEKAIEKAKQYHIAKFNKANELKEAYFAKYESKTRKYTLAELKDRYYNESLMELVKATNVKNKFIEFNGKLLQQTDPIYKEPLPTKNPIDYRTHYLAPKKRFAGQKFETFRFNLTVIWLMSLGLYATLYFESFSKVGGLLGVLFHKLITQIEKLGIGGKIKDLFSKIAELKNKMKLPQLRKKKD